MFLLNFIRYLRGYVKFIVTGAFVERFLNLAARDRIPLWDGRKRGDSFTGSTIASEYRKLRKHAKKARVKMRIIEKSGAPFKRRQYRKRTGLLVGLGIFLVFVYLMSCFIWRIEINGCERVAESEVIAVLEELGVSSGVFRSSIDVRGAERRALLALDDLSWIALNIKGSTLHVEVRESDQKPAMIDPDMPCNVVAARSGQIISMVVHSGQAVKQIGDTALEGDVVVSGITQDRLGQNLFKHARAQIVAKVQHRIIIKIPFKQTEFVETGDVRNRSFLHILGWDLPLFWPQKIPQPYHVEREKNMFTIAGKELPCGILQEKYTLMREVPVIYTEGEAKLLALKELDLRQRLELTDAEILDKSAYGTTEGDTFILTAEYVCTMDIAKERQILKSE